MSLAEHSSTDQNTGSPAPPAPGAYDGIPEGTPVGALVPQKHGGALRNGGPSRGNPHPVSSIRARVQRALRNDFIGRRHIVRDIADGEPVQKTTVLLAQALLHAQCPACGEKGLKPAPGTSKYLTIEGKTTAAPADRLKAVDLMGRYGGLSPNNETKVTLVSPDVQTRLNGTIEVVMRFPGLTDAQRDGLLDQMEAVWA